jgi:hypothetical protein
MSSLLLIQVIYKALWLLVFVLPRFLSGRMGEVPWGIALTFLVIVVTYPWIIPWEQFLARLRLRPSRGSASLDRKLDHAALTRGRP